MKKFRVIFYILLVALSIFVCFKLEHKESVNIQIEESETFPPKENLEELKGKEIQ